MSNLARMVERHTADLKRAGYEISEWADPTGYVLDVPLPNQPERSVKIYFVCEGSFPHKPPGLLVTAAVDINSWGEIVEEELPLPRLNTIVTWSQSSKLVDVVREVETKLLVNGFNQYGEIE